MCDPAEENCDKGVSGLGNVELDIQAVHNIRCVCVCVCVCEMYGKRKYEITKDLKGVI